MIDRLIAILACMHGTVGFCAVASVDRPNIVFIFTDDHSTAAIGSYGSRINRTPNIDRLATEGMLFENVFCTNSICAPSRAVILTGTHNHINGVIDNGVRFDGSQVTFPALLQESGYQTAIIGKWHLKSDPVGFDYWEILPGQGQYYGPDFRTGEGTRRYPGYCTDITTDLAITWLEKTRDKDRPFLLMCQHKAPHRSWMPGPDHLLMYEGEEIPEPATLLDDWSGRGTASTLQEMTIDRHMSMYYDLKVPPVDGEENYQGLHRAAARNLSRMSEDERAAWDAAYGPRNEAFRAAELEGDALVRWKYQRYIKDYLRCIASVDDSIGRILASLEEQGLEDNTVVIYSSDQGFYLGEHGWYDKRWMYEESLRMPFIIRWPGKVQPGTRERSLVQNLDFAETFLEMAGHEIPRVMQGRSLVPLLSGEVPVPGWRESIYYHYYENPGVHNVPRHEGVRTDRYKLMHFYHLGEWELYDLFADPDEMYNRFDDPTLAEEQEMLVSELQRLRVEYELPPLDQPSIP